MRASREDSQRFIKNCDNRDDIIVILARGGCVCVCVLLNIDFGRCLDFGSPKEGCVRVLHWNYHFLDQEYGAILM